jgi:hypothetical protein
MHFAKSLAASWTPTRHSRSKISRNGGASGPREERECWRRSATRLVEVDVESQRAWVLARDVRDMASAKSPNAARLLPAFDPWVIGASRRAAALLDPEHKARIYRGQGWISPALLVNGRMVGVWRHTRKGRRLLVEIEPFGMLSAWARAQLEAEVERLAEFLDCELSGSGRPIVLRRSGSHKRSGVLAA